MLVLVEAGYDVVVLDNLSNSSACSVKRVGELTGRHIPLVEADIRDASALRELFWEHPFDGVFHFAGLKSVNESVADPLRYYEHNVVGSVVLLREMAAAGIRRIVFSSSATVYGDARALPVTEQALLQPVNPYGATKLQVETILKDLCSADRAWAAVGLRYFNPVGAHSSGRIGEDPCGEPGNLMPYVAQVAAGMREKLRIFGADYATPDGTGVRDYIHVMDLAEGHLAAYRFLEETAGYRAVNLGTGQGHSVLEVVEVFRRESGRNIPWEIAPRRAGDIACSYADVELAFRLFGWRATRTLSDMCRDHWRWQRTHPEGYP